MAKFAKGDKVRVVKAEFNPMLVGMHAYVESIADDAETMTIGFPVIAAKVAGYGLVHFALNELELIVDPPSFKVGDRVKVVAPHYEGTRWYGLIGVVTLAPEGNDISVVKFSDDWRDAYASGGFNSNELEPLAPVPSYAVGDKIRILPTTTTGYAGRTFTVASIDVYEGKARVGARVNDVGDVVGFFLDEIEPYVAPPIVWRERAELGKFPVHVERARIDEWVREGREWWRANPSAEGDWSSSSGDAKVFVDRSGEARLYRLEATSKHDNASTEV